MLFHDISEGTADQKINFRLLRPTLKGVGYDQKSIRVRPETGPDELYVKNDKEALSSWSALHSWSVHYKLSTEFGCLRVKQFLYDWGPSSTLDHAALCDYRLNCLRVRPLDHLRVAWIGYDYAKLPALSMLAWGTNLELRELAGKHSDNYLLDLAKTFEPVSDHQLLPMAKRSYWSRWQRYDLNMVRQLGYRIPSSLWLWRWPWQPVEHYWTSNLDALSLSGSKVSLDKVFFPDWFLDSGCIFGERHNPVEVQLLYMPKSHFGHTQLWLRQFLRDAGSIREPEAGQWPLLDYSGKNTLIYRKRLTNAEGLNAFLASRTIQYGPHDIVWWREHHGFLLQISAAVGHDLSYAIDLFSKFLGENMTLCEDG